MHLLNISRRQKGAGKYKYKHLCVYGESFTNKLVKLYHGMHFKIQHTG
jgi:hypothetical protein